MASVLREPVGIGAFNEWAVAGTTNKVLAVTDASPSTFINSNNAGDRQEYTLGTAPNQNGIATNVSVVVKHKVLSGNNITIQVLLLDGSTTIETKTISNNGVTSWATIDVPFSNITEAQAETNLRVRVRTFSLAGSKPRRFDIDNIDVKYTIADDNNAIMFGMNS